MQGSGGLAGVSIGISEPVLWLLVVLVVAVGGWTAWKFFWAAH